MTRIAKVGLFSRQKKFRDWRFMHGMTTGADYAGQSMRGAPNVCARQRLVVASQAIIQNLPWFKLGKCNDCGLAPVRLDVRLTGAVAALAASPVGRFISGGNTFVVGVLVELGPHIRVAGLANVATNVAGFSPGVPRSRYRGEQRQKDKY